MCFFYSHIDSLWKFKNTLATHIRKRRRLHMFLEFPDFGSDKCNALENAYVSVKF